MGIGSRCFGVVFGGLFTLVGKGDLEEHAYITVAYVYTQRYDTFPVTAGWWRVCL